MELREIGIIGGGQMAEAMIRGFIDKGMFTPENILVSEPVEERRNYLEKNYKVKTTDKNLEVVKNRNILILAVKPQVMKLVLEEIKSALTPEHLIITIAAGLPIRFYESILGEVRLIRVMPNTCALVHRSISALSKGGSAKPEDLKVAQEIFSAIGETVIVDENLIDAITALSGSGPAYVSLFVEALVDAGVNAGLPRPLAEKLAFATVLGTVELMKKGQKNPYELKSMVTSPGGTTIAALKVMYEKGLPGIVMEAIFKAYERSKELSKAVK